MTVTSRNAAQPGIALVYFVFCSSLDVIANRLVKR